MAQEIISTIQICTQVGESHSEMRMIATLQDGVFIAHKTDDNYVYAGSAQNTSIIKHMSGLDIQEVIRMMTLAVNNRTKERDYFRLYGEMLDRTITEDEFDKELEEHEDDYVISSDITPTVEQLKNALLLSSGFKDAGTSEELSSLFSFNSLETGKVLKEMAEYTNIGDTIECDARSQRD